MHIDLAFVEILYDLGFDGREPVFRVIIFGQQLIFGLTSSVLKNIWVFFSVWVTKATPDDVLEYQWLLLHQPVRNEHSFQQMLFQL